MSRIALYTFGVLKTPTGSRLLVDFVTTAPSVFTEAEAIEGFWGMRSLPARTLLANLSSVKTSDPGASLSPLAFLTASPSRAKRQ
jgi:hypothetical protein